VTIKRSAQSIGLLFIVSGMIGCSSNGVVAAPGIQVGKDDMSTVPTDLKDHVLAVQPKRVAPGPDGKPP
jgi:hypothetical protein